MNLNIRIISFFLPFILLFPVANAQDFYSSIVKKAAWNNGYELPQKTHLKINRALSEIGRTLFESKRLSLNGNISCATCHIDKHGSSDGIPNAVGIGGLGKSTARLRSGGSIIPRNSLGLFGVGGHGFNAFFWDGRVEFKNNKLISPFGPDIPSLDPLVVAIHLPVAEIRETLQEDQFISAHKKETVRAAGVVYEAILYNLKKNEPKALNKLAEILNKRLIELKFEDVAKAIAHFIRYKFQLKQSRFSKFMKGAIKLSKKELLGGVIFYGKGGCAGCHSGPYFSDFNYHTVAFPQAGFGKNGFGVDYGRYNVTFNPNDIFKFRTPSLHNISKTKPYGHSGSISSLRDAIKGHYDPLAFFDPKTKTPAERFEFLKYLKNEDAIDIIDTLTENELNQIIAFLKTLEFKGNE